MDWNLASESLSCRSRSFSFCRLSRSLSAASRSLCTAWLRCSASLFAESDSESCLRICWTEDCAESRRPRTSCSTTKSHLQASSTPGKPSQCSEQRWDSSIGCNTQRSYFSYVNMIIKLLHIVSFIGIILCITVSSKGDTKHLPFSVFCLNFLHFPSWDPLSYI